MTYPLIHGRRRGGARLLVGAVTLLTLGTAAACTGSSSGPEAQRTPTPRASTQPAATLAPRPAAAQVRVTRVSGTLRARDRKALEARVGKVVTTYFDDAFLGGDYPRSSFKDAFATFSPGARREARGARELLTNQLLGPTTESVVPREQTAYLSVLAPFDAAAGVTARVHLVFLAERGERADRTVTVDGRLLLTRKPSGGWMIFGYDLSRSSTAGGAG
ncbi:hypothetical protein [Nocardioides mesophilus]|uniref:Nuclear transport factor 2 family protein n=1 Tax=Nocardioides mesophilus TaxID=433659 RepID=A0A7G9R8M3_9ACTN|nr:hypothetical protein [Nocardioides mesophilus]QNN51948.1 hypothetical protein H9L09_15675 [Nocardioides mesophilus]